MAEKEQEYRQIGSVLKPHGVRGEFVVFLESDFPDWVAERETLYALVDGEMKIWNVIGSRLRNNKLIMAVAEHPSRTEIEKMIKTPLFVTEEDARAAVDDPDYFYNSDLVGLSVEHALSDTAFGVVKSVVEMPAQNLLEVQRPEGNIFLFPFTSALIKDIDLEKGVIRVLMPEGMLDANEETEEDDDDSGKRGGKRGGKAGA